MDRQEAEKLLKAHRNGNIKPTAKVKDAIDFIIADNHKIVEVEDSRVKPLQNRCYMYTQGQLCIFCPMECEHRVNPFRRKSEE